MKRTDYISWDEYFMGVALLSAQRSKDPNTQVGACIVNPDKKIVGVGYNGFPSGCDDDVLPWEREGSFLETKYPYVCHAELFPCNECAKAIIQSGIKEIVYLSDKYDGTDSVVASKRMLNQAGVTMRKLKLDREDITISFQVEA
jgi:dCMP deaminase